YQRLTSLALVALANSDRDALSRQALQAEQTAGMIDQLGELLRRGGTTRLTDSTDVLPRVDDPQLRTGLAKVRRLWASEQQAAQRIFGADALRRGDDAYSRDFTQRAAHLDQALEASFRRVDELIAHRVARVQWLGFGLHGGGILLAVVVVVVVYRQL